MGYFYFKPGQPQYFFPENFKKHDFLLAIFQAYNLKGKLFWWAWKNFKIVRNTFFLSDIEKYVPEALIRKNLEGKPILAFNSGSLGPEQKISALGFQDGKSFFIKFGQTAIAKENVRNEARILNQLQQLHFVPRVLNLIENQDFVLLKTNCLEGKRLGNEKLDSDLVEVLVQLSKLEIVTEKNSKTEVQTSFAHGDFCPWNLMNNKGIIEIFDWEMAGTYPLGYDLFTYIFQPSFLLSPKITVGELLSENRELIELFFAKLEISDWKLYLAAFAATKLQSETEKNNQRLMPFYNHLLVYAIKA